MAYYSMKDLRERLRCSSKKIYRWMTRDVNPFPAPSIRHAGGCSLWLVARVAAWERRERKRTQYEALSLNGRVVDTKRRNPHHINPADVLDIPVAEWMVDGGMTVNLVARRVPLEMVETIASPFSLAVAKAVGFTDREAAILTKRVLNYLQEATEEVPRPDEHDGHPPDQPLQDDIPF